MVYTVQAGDTLAQIATTHSVPGGWQTVWDDNRDVLVDPNTIAVGEHLRIPPSAPAATPPFTESIIHTTSDVIAGITGKPGSIIMLTPAKPTTRTASPAGKPTARTASPAVKPPAVT
ncbi:MAG: LysM peptidoglycan-binding domain-containing protein, partial [Pseudonocardiaceae bacterium]